MALIDTQAAALVLDMPPATVRWYAHTGRLTTAGRSGRRALYRLDDVERLAAARRLLDTRKNIANTS